MLIVTALFKDQRGKVTARREWCDRGQLVRVYNGKKQVSELQAGDQIVLHDESIATIAEILTRTV